jgi:hypothetical protein
MQPAKILRFRERICGSGIVAAAKKKVNIMCSFVYRDLISEKLEIARTLGLVTRYVVRSTENANVGVRVWRSPDTSEEAIIAYLTRLLDGLVAAPQIVVLPQVPAEGEVARPERVDVPLMPDVPAAA